MVETPIAIRQMNILLINVHSTRNAGDAILLQSSVDQIGRAFSGSKIKVVTNDLVNYTGETVAYASFSAWVKSFALEHEGWHWDGLFFMPLHLLKLAIVLLVWRLTSIYLPLFRSKEKRELIRSYFEADLIVSAAGNYLYSSGAIGIPYLLAVFSIAFGHWSGKPLVMLPQTVGPVKGWRDKRLLSWITDKFSLVLLRDHNSVEELRSCGFDVSRCQIVPDLAFGFGESDLESAQKLLARYGIKPREEAALLGVTMLNWAGLNSTFEYQGRYEKAVAAAVRHFVENIGGKVILFSQVQGPTHVEDDRIIAARINQMLEDIQEKIVFVQEDVSAEILKSAYGMMDIFLGTRLHSNIFALTENVPVVAIAYQPKTAGTLKMLGLEKWVVKIDEVDETNLIALLDALWLQRNTIQGQITTQLSGIEAQLDTIPELMRALVNTQ